MCKQHKTWYVNDIPPNQKLYLACPYSDNDRQKREYRFERANEEALLLMQQGHIVFSPITHGHAIAQTATLEQREQVAMNHNFWMEQCVSFLTEWADAIVVLCLPGWQLSRGVTMEVEIAKEKGIPVYYIQKS